MSRPTMDTVAERAGVSRALVSLVMNDSPKVSDAKRTAVLEAAAALGYLPNLHARSLAQQRTKTFGIIINDIHNPFFAEVVSGIEAAADEHGFSVLILNGGRDPGRERRAVETHLQFQVEALILVGTRLDDDELEQASRVAPTVIVASGPDHPGVDTITANDTIGAALAVDHLVALGHTDIVHLDGGDNISSRPRAAGFARAMRAAGLEPRVVRAGDGEADAEAAVVQLVEEEAVPTAIFAFNDLLAAGVLDVLESAGLRVPDDVSVVGYDNTFIAQLNHMSLTAVDQPRRKMGELAVQTMLERIEDNRTKPTNLDLAPTLAVRGSTGPPRHDGTTR
ncbi:MAG: LacI family DNA-binding transcriptional regulator [Acidimicrobiales bacterium]